MANFIQSVDERTQLAGANRLEVLLFSLGTDKQTQRREVFGINVFKVREVMHVPEITHAPDMPQAVEGMISLRGVMIPVVNLPKFCNINIEEPPGILIITEYNKHMQGFLVNAVETIERLAWVDVKEPPAMLAARLGGLVTAVTELSDDRIVMIMDVEKVLSETADFSQDESIFDAVEKVENKDIKILFADDSQVARDQIVRTFDHMGISYMSAKNGLEAWKKILSIAEKAEAEGKPITDYVNIILTDVELPEMDGYVLTKKIKEDARTKDLPVIMHSSLSAEANQALGHGVGANAYVPKFDPAEMATTIKRLINEGVDVPE
ncbi:MAG: chemotaxis protein [bacterium]